HPRQLQIQIHRPAMHQHGGHAQADVLQAVDQVVARLGHGGEILEESILVDTRVVFPHRAPVSVASLSNIEKDFGERVLFDKINLTIYENERIGLIGANGSG